NNLLGEKDIQLRRDRFELDFVLRIADERNEWLRGLRVHRLLQHLRRAEADVPIGAREIAEGLLQGNLWGGIGRNGGIRGTRTRQKRKKNPSDPPAPSAPPG